MRVKLTYHADRGKWVVNTPGSHVQRQPRTYRSRERALARVAELTPGSAGVGQE